MEKASPVEIRKCMEMANALARAGIRFVAVPVSNDIEFTAEMAKAINKLESLEKECE
ncbi:MAG: DUF1382 family protein [Plesiomonas shigelloides]